MKSQSLSAIKSISVFGGSSVTGKVLIKHALKKGLRVKTLVRYPDSLGDSLQGAEIVKGSLENTDDIDASLSNTDAVICLFGPRSPYTDIFCEQATKAIIASMKKNNINRLICQTGGMIGDYPNNRTFFFKKMISLFNKRLPLIAHDRAGQEQQVISSGLNWTVIKPPRLVDKPATGKVLAGTDVKLALLSSLTREDLSDILINEALSVNYVSNAIFIKNCTLLNH